MDKEWTKSARESEEYGDGLNYFLDYAYTKGKPDANRHYVVKSVQREFLNIEDPPEHAVNLSSGTKTCEVELVRNDIPPTITKKPPPVSDEIESDDDSNA